jgi:NADH-quinone oxidoreductase subunit A
MQSGYIPMFVMMAVAAVVAGGMVGASFLLGPKNPSRYKNSPYECGMTPVGSARERFPVKFYLIAMLFIIFDVETIFLYPWVVTFRENTRAMKLFLLAEMLVFVAILLVGYFYILGRKALDWDEGQEGETAEQAPGIFRPRRPIRFGNENSGPVNLPVAARTGSEAGRG